MLNGFPVGAVRVLDAMLLRSGVTSPKSLPAMWFCAMGLNYVASLAEELRATRRRGLRVAKSRFAET